MHKFISAATTLGLLVILLSACSNPMNHRMVTIADARTEPAQYIDTGESGDSVGDILTFDQPLLSEDGQKLGTNSGICIRTRVGHSFQCQWTLVFTDGSIQVAGREFDKGTSNISIVGGTGKFSGISGEMQSLNNNNGTFTQTLIYHLREKHAD